MDGILGTLGGRGVSQGWYEGSNLITSSASGSIAMDRTHSLTWAPDYALALIILGVVVAVVVVAIGLALYRMRKGGRETLR